MTLVLIWIVGGLAILGFLILFYKIVKDHVLIEDKKNQIVKKFVKENKDLTIREINVKYHKMYNSLDEKLRENYPVDVLWQSILKDLAK